MWLGKESCVRCGAECQTVASWVQCQDDEALWIGWMYGLCNEERYLQELWLHCEWELEIESARKAGPSWDYAFLAKTRGSHPGSAESCW